MSADHRVSRFHQSIWLSPNLHFRRHRHPLIFKIKPLPFSREPLLHGEEEPERICRIAGTLKRSLSSYLCQGTHGRGFDQPRLWIFYGSSVWPPSSTEGDKPDHEGSASLDGGRNGLPAHKAHIAPVNAIHRPLGGACSSKNMVTPPWAVRLHARASASSWLPLRMTSRRQIEIALRAFVRRPR